ncbi:MAG TPA: hypothetical protein VL026_09160 [Rhizomicrobium sp.]|nr:hypothetical protein [Rhizomicrobium sp.]
MIERLAEKVNADTALVRRGRFLNVVFLFDDGNVPWLITVTAGRIESAVKGPFVMASYTFGLRARTDAWAKFCQAEPEPGFHDIMALIKQRLLKIEGNVHPFMANLFYFKAVLAKLRKERAV